MQRLMKEKISGLQVVLTVLYVVCLLSTNITVIKTVQLPFGLEMTAGMWLFPIVYILSDVFSEVYGYRWSRITCWLAFAMNCLMALTFALTIAAPGGTTWTEQLALETILGNTPRAFIASMCALCVGDWANDIVFRNMKKNHPDTQEGFGARAILSSLVGEICDSAVFMSIMFLGQMPIADIIQIAVVEITLKVGYEVVVLPVTKAVTKRVLATENRVLDAA